VSRRETVDCIEASETTSAPANRRGLSKRYQAELKRLTVKKLAHLVRERHSGRLPAACSRCGSAVVLRAIGRNGARATGAEGRKSAGDKRNELIRV
jgi:hypothetical protein